MDHPPGRLRGGDRGKPSSGLPYRAPLVRLQGADAYPSAPMQQQNPVSGADLSLFAAETLAGPQDHLTKSPEQLVTLLLQSPFGLKCALHPGNDLLYFQMSSGRTICRDCPNACESQLLTACQIVSVVEAKRGCVSACVFNCA
jgi:hypothetical protein